MRDNIVAMTCKKSDQTVPPPSPPSPPSKGTPTPPPPGVEGANAPAEPKVGHSESEVSDLHQAVEDISDIGSDIVARLNKVVFNASPCGRCFKPGTKDTADKSKTFCSKIFPLHVS